MTYQHYASSFDFAPLAYGSQMYFNSPADHDYLNQVAYIASHNMLPGPSGRATETKPRLSKQEVDKLEATFQTNNKPSSNLKRELAEQMGVDIARINNWFQNRRAKAKQEKRSQENEARRKSEQGADNTTTSSDTVKEYYASKNQDDDLRPSAAPFPPVKAPAGTSIREESPSDGIETPAGLGQKQQSAVDGNDLPYASPDSDVNLQDVEDIPYSLDPGSFPFSDETSCGFPSSLTTPAPCLTLSIPSQPMDGQFVPQILDSVDASPLSSYQHLSAPGDMEDALPPQYMPNVDMKQEQMQNGSLQHCGQYSPASMGQSSPELGTESRFWSRPAIDIANRRNTKRPPQLISCRSNSYNLSGPKTGTDAPRRKEAPSPMRRVASATGSFPRGVQKPVSAGPRSPMQFDRNQEQLLWQLASHSPVSRGSVAPPTPNTPVVPTQQNMCETTVSSEEDKSYLVQNNLTVPQHPLDPTLRTPPDTPGMLTSMGPFWYPSYDNAVSDEYMPATNFGSFDTDISGLSMSVPAYVQGCPSQPETPLYAPSNMGLAQAYLSCSTGYAWPGPNGSSASAKPSPEQSRSAELQFDHKTPQDFRQ